MHSDGDRTAVSGKAHDFNETSSSGLNTTVPTFCSIIGPLIVSVLFKLIEMHNIQKVDTDTGIGYKPAQEVDIGRRILPCPNSRNATADVSEK